MVEIEKDVEFQYGERLGEFNGMSSQSYVSHCRVLPLGKFTVTIPEPHATLQGAVTWRNQCHDRATLQGVRIASDEYLAIGSMTAGVRSTIATVDGAVYRTDRHASVNLVCHSRHGLEDDAEAKRTEFNCTRR